MIEDGFCCGAVQNKAEICRGQVRDAARRLFIDHGFHATGIAQIARESGVAVGQLYRDFASKEEIVAAIVNADCRGFMAADCLRAAIRNGDRAHVHDWIHQLVQPDDDTDGMRLFAEIVAESARNARIAAIFDEIQDDVRGLMYEALAMLAPGDALAERRATVGDTILTLSLGLMHHQLVRPQMHRSALVRALAGIVDAELDRLQEGARRLVA